MYYVDFNNTRYFACALRRLKIGAPFALASLVTSIQLKNLQISVNN